LFFQGHFQGMPMKKKEKDSFARRFTDRKSKVKFTFIKNIPADFLELINEYFPPELSRKWGNFDAIEKWVKSKRNWPEGTDSRYKHRSGVHRAAVEVHRKNPSLRAPGIRQHPLVQEAGGKHYAPRTVEEWIREVIKLPAGAPKKSTK
jgi:hypothetical protein